MGKDIATIAYGMNSHVRDTLLVLFQSKLGESPDYQPFLQKLCLYFGSHYGPGGKATLEHHYSTLDLSEGAFVEAAYGLVLMVVTSVNRELPAFKSLVDQLDQVFQNTSNNCEGFFGTNFAKATTGSGGDGDSREGAHQVPAFTSAHDLICTLIDLVGAKQQQDPQTVKKARDSRTNVLLFSKMHTLVLVNYDYLIQVYSTSLANTYHGGEANEQLIKKNLRLFLQLAELRQTQVANASSLLRPPRIIT